MSNVIRLNRPLPSHGADACRVALIAGFAQHRRPPGEVSWLQENAALLRVLRVTGARPGQAALAPHEAFHATVERRLGFFPHHYRLLLSICLDLEDLGLRGGKGEILAHRIAREGLVDAELSDLRRLEARCLLLRRGIDPLPEDDGLEDRVRAFIDRSDSFALPDHQAARDLARIVLHLSAHGRRDPGLSDAARTSLEFAGILAYLEQDAGLLAEICLAQRYGGMRSPPIWEDWLEREAHRFTIRTGADIALQDDYGGYLACNWLMAAAGRDAFLLATHHPSMTFHRGATIAGPLRAISDYLYGLADGRSDDWHAMRPDLCAILPEPHRRILIEAERSSDRFAAFFAGFARTGLRGVTL